KPVTPPGERSSLSRAARLAVEDMSLLDALTQLYETSGVPISFSPSRLPRDRRVSCRCETVSVADALDRLLEGTVFRYREIGGLVLVFDDDPLPARARLGDPGVVVLARQTQSVSPHELLAPRLAEWQQQAEIGGTVMDT